MSRTINLRIFKNEQLVGSRSFSQEVIKIGKLRSSDLHLEDDAVARMHAVLEVTPNDLRLVDLGSASGTSVNGRPVSKSAAIASGDSLWVGPFRLELHAQPIAAAIAPTAAMVGTPSFAPAIATATATAMAYAPAPAISPASPRATLPLDTSEIEEPDHHVAEVIARYGGTVLDVQHVGQVRSRRGQAPALLALGGLMLLGGASIVASEVSQDWDAHQEATAFAQASGRVAPEAPGSGLGGLGIGLALLGLVPLGLGAVRRNDVGLDRYTVGEGHEASFHVAADGLPEGSAFPLVAKHGEDYVLRFTPQMRGHVTLNGERHELEALVRAGRVGTSGSAYALPLPRGAEAHVEHGSVTYRVASVTGGKAIAKRGETDKPFWIYNAASGAVLGGLLAAVHLIPEEALNMNMDELVAENRYVGYMQQPDLEKEPEVQPIVPEANQEDTGGKGERHKGAEGKMGNPKTPTKSGLYAMKGPKTAVPTMARDFDPEMKARNTGILGLIEQESGHFLSSPYGAFAVGTDDSDVWGGLTGTEIADAHGLGGMGNIGTGRGGGGNGEGTIGLGNVGLLGKGGGGGDRVGYGRGSGTGHSQRVPKGPEIRQGKAKIDGNSVDKDVIRRIIRNHHNEIRHCYNEGLAKDPRLQGRVAVMFTIGPTGLVPSAAVTENTMGDRNVANCVAAAVRRWKFPKPMNGGTAMVTYPFTFSPG